MLAGTGVASAVSEAPVWGFASLSSPAARAFVREHCPTGVFTSNDNPVRFIDGRFHQTTASGLNRMIRHFQNPYDYKGRFVLVGLEIDADEPVYLPSGVDCDIRDCQVVMRPGVVHGFSMDDGDINRRVLTWQHPDPVVIHRVSHGRRKLQISNTDVVAAC